MIPAYTQVPEHMSFQAVIRNSTNQLVADRSVGIRISILKGSIDGTSVYIETQQPTTNANGLISILIGNGVVVSGDFSAIDWGADKYYIKIETDINGGNNYSITGISQILSVPYAFLSKEAETADYNKLIHRPDFAAVSTSGLYNDLTDKPANLSDFNDDLNLFSGNWDDLTGKPTFAEVATSGSYIDLLDKPNIPSIIDTSVSNNTLWSSAKTNTEVKRKIDSTNVYSKTDLQTSGQAIVHYNNISNKPVNLDEDKTDDVNLSGDQSIDGNKEFTGTVTVPSPMNDNDAATKAYIDLIRKQIYTQVAGGNVSDADGNTYNTVKIGEQIWMAENLKTTKYNDSTDIPVQWYVWYDNDETTYKDVYGALYNRIIIDNKLCPVGWHIPTISEWRDLMNYLGKCYMLQPGTIYIDSIAGGKLKETGLTHWNSPNLSSSDEVGFTALPGGEYYSGDGYEIDPYFTGLGKFGTWFGFDDPYDYVITLYSDKKNCLLIKMSAETYEHLSYSIRCIKD